MSKKTKAKEPQVIIPLSEYERLLDRDKKYTSNSHAWLTSNRELLTHIKELESQWREAVTAPLGYQIASNTWVISGEARQELLDLKEGMSKDSELGALVRKMPVSSGLLHYRSVHGEDLWAYSTEIHDLKVDLVSVRADPRETLHFVLEPLEEEK